MTDIRYTATDLMKTRFVISPLSVTSLSAKVVYNPRQYPLYSRWVAYAREALNGIKLPALADFHLGAPSCMPDLLAPFPVHPAPTFEDELQRIATYSEDLIEESIDFQIRFDPPDADLRKYQRRPLLLREQVVDDLLTYWKRVVKPHWAQIHSVLEGDILQRSRQLAREGYERMIMQLDPRVTVVADYVTIDSSKLHVTIDLAGAGIILMPDIFADRTRIGIAPTHYEGLTLSYAALGSGNWRDDRTIEPSDAMSLMIGEHRARLMFQLQRPVTTLELARSLHLTPGAISQQLKQLHQADFVSKHRVGKRVYYKLTGRGENLLNIFN